MASLTRRDFLGRTLGAAAGVLTAPALGLGASVPSTTSVNTMRIVFATDAHLMVDDSFGSADGIVACARAIEAVQPELILFGGDLTHDSPGLDLPAAEKLLERALFLWRSGTERPTHFTLGNHDLAGITNAGVARSDPRFGKGILRKGLKREHHWFAFRQGGWRFLVLDDVSLHEDGTYEGEYAAEQLAFVRDELSREPEVPTVVCGHIPALSVLPTMGGRSKQVDRTVQTKSSLIAGNTKALLDVFADTKAQVKLVLGGHLHHLERIEVNDVVFLNGGAVCGNWWRGPLEGCAEGFTVLDLRSDGSHNASYRTFGWKALKSPA